MPASPIGYAYVGPRPVLDPAWGPAAARAFYTEAGRVGVRLKRQSLVKGLGRDGRPMVQISGKTRASRDADIDPVTGRKPYSPMGRARSHLPPLQATGKLSRTYTLLTFEPRADQVWFHWGVDTHTGKDWGEILALHRTGFIAHFRDGDAEIPSRDVIGLSPADTRALDAHMAAWWEINRRRFPVLKQPDRNRMPAGDPRVYATGRGHITGMSERDTVGDFGKFFGFQRGGGGPTADFGNLPPMQPPPGNPTPTPPRTPQPRLQTSVRRRPVVAPRPVPLVGAPRDSYLPQPILDALPDELKGVETFGQLSRLRIGRLWWAAVGLTIFLELVRRAAA